ncbi:DUF2690 domain-containing protein [Streptomyces sp. NPDC006193]|uniref:helix-turn-helix domain-containing protein n=1 Tax=Streptomyces sp. NPDC006193 TaxID=3155717 RepID=UPI0033BC71B6
MPRWKALPEDLDPQIKEFIERMRRLVDRSGLSLPVLADRTGYSRTSWERYLGGRLLAPKGAVIALAEATGTQPVPLTTLWELAERAWSRAEEGNDSTAEALRIARARAALGDLGTAAAGTGGASRGGAGRPPVTAARKGGGMTAVTGIAGPAGVSPTLPARTPTPDTGAHDGDTPAPPASHGPGTRPGGGSGAAVAGGAAPSGDGSRTAAEHSRTEVGGGSPAARDDSPATPGGGARTAAGSATGGSTSSSGGNSWGLAGYRGPSKAGARPGSRPLAGAPGPAAAPGVTAHAPVLRTGASAPATGASAPARTASAPTPGAAAPHGGGPVPPRPVPADAPPRRQQVTMFLAGLFSVLALIAGVFFLTHRDGDGGTGGAAAEPSPSARPRASLPPGVECTGSACTGKDAEAMGCSGELVTTARSVTLGATVLEVRYSRTCGAAWGRITSGAPGDTVRVTAGRVRQSDDITVAGDTIAYTPMVAVKDPAEARACATLASGRTGCTP